MREDRHDDLVSTTAIIAGTVAGVAVTVMSLLFSGDEAAPDALPGLQDDEVVWFAEPSLPPPDHAPVPTLDAEGRR